MFLTLDGIDGVGKTTQLELLLPWLQQRGQEVVTCRDPGSTPLGEELRRILLGHHGLAVHRRSEMLLYMAARAQLVEEVIRPALDAGRTVVSDRFLLANVVYQGYAGGLDVASIWRVGQVATGGIQPAVTVLLDMDPATAARRLQRTLDRMEAQGLEYLRRVREGYLEEARRRPEQIVVIDAGRDVERVQREIRAAVEHAMSSQK